MESFKSIELVWSFLSKSRSKFKLMEMTKGSLYLIDFV